MATQFAEEGAHWLEGLLLAACGLKKLHTGFFRDWLSASRSRDLSVELNLAFAQGKLPSVRGHKLFPLNLGCNQSKLLCPFLNLSLPTEYAIPLSMQSG